ncbi:MAG: hypothetical protein RLZZ175_2781 [Bacteroidota bacterium]|jgi:hypothetical protein
MAKIKDCIVIEKDDLGLSDPWCLVEVLDKLIMATEVLLDKENYDRHGWEEVHYAKEKAKEYKKKLYKIHKPLEQIVAKSWEFESQKMQLQDYLENTEV